MRESMMRNVLTMFVCFLGSMACGGDLDFVAPDPDTFVIQALFFRMSQSSG